MGRTSQEQMLGKSFQERVETAKRRGFIYHIRSLLRINKEKPTRYANVRRHGVAQINAELVNKR